MTAAEKIKTQERMKPRLLAIDGAQLLLKEKTAATAIILANVIMLAIAFAPTLACAFEKGWL
jgi:hypothetical protein